MAYSYNSKTRRFYDGDGRVIKREVGLRSPIARRQYEAAAAKLLHAKVPRKSAAQRAAEEAARALAAKRAAAAQKAAATRAAKKAQAAEAARVAAEKAARRSAAAKKAAATRAMKREAAADGARQFFERLRQQAAEDAAPEPPSIPAGFEPVGIDADDDDGDEFDVDGDEQEWDEPVIRDLDVDWLYDDFGDLDIPTEEQDS